MQTRECAKGNVSFRYQLNILWRRIEVENGGRTGLRQSVQEHMAPTTPVACRVVRWDSRIPVKHRHHHLHAVFKTLEHRAGAPVQGHVAEHGGGYSPGWTPCSVLCPLFCWSDLMKSQGEEAGTLRGNQGKRRGHWGNLWSVRLPEWHIYRTELETRLDFWHSRIRANSRPAWPTRQVWNQPELHHKTLSQKQKGLGIRLSW